MISTSYFVGMCAIYSGFILLLLEILLEPSLQEVTLQLQCCLFAIVLFFASWFTLAVVSPEAPLTIDSYAIATEEYPSENAIAGIPWNYHFTDLRVSITNPTDTDYHGVDLAVQPDRWNYKAAIVEKDSGCMVTSMGGNSVLVVPSGKGGATRITAHRVGENFQAEDNAGDVFEPFITEGGARLRCAQLPAHFTIQIVFALASVDQNLMSTMALRNKPGEWGLSMAEMLPMNKFDLLAPRPSTSQVTIKGNYGRGVKTFLMSRIVHVQNGN